MKLQVPKWMRRVLPASLQGTVEFTDGPEPEGTEEEPFVPNRAMRRAWQFGPDNRRKGPGYTRSFRKGRKQRGS